jgi:hypothetical protein
MSEIPIPQDTGSTGSQEASVSELASIEKESPLSGLPITQKIEGLAATHSRSMGGELAANLLAGSFTQLSHDLQASRQELTNTRDQLRQATSDLSSARTRCAVLEALAKSDAKNRHLKNFCIFTGTVLLGIGIELSRNSFETSSYITGGLGALLLLFGWFTSNSRPVQ